MPASGHPYELTEVSMRLLLDTTGMSFAIGSDFEPVTDFTTKQPKADEHGVPLFAVDLTVAYRDARGKFTTEVIKVKLPNPRPIEPLTPVRVTNLIALPWASNGKNGVAYRADKIEASTAAKAS